MNTAKCEREHIYNFQFMYFQINECCWFLSQLNFQTDKNFSLLVEISDQSIYILSLQIQANDAKFILLILLCSSLDALKTLKRSSPDLYLYQTRIHIKHQDELQNYFMNSAYIILYSKGSFLCILALLWNKWENASTTKG